MKFTERDKYLQVCVFLFTMNAIFFSHRMPSPDVATVSLIQPLNHVSFTKSLLIKQ